MTHNEIQFLRFECDDGHVSAVRYGTDEVYMSNCPVCGIEDVSQIEPQYVDADITVDSTFIQINK